MKLVILRIIQGKFPTAVFIEKVISLSFYVAVCRLLKGLYMQGISGKKLWQWVLKEF